MKTSIALLIACVLHAEPPTIQLPTGLKEFLAARVVVGPTSKAVNYRVAYKSAVRGKSKGVFKDIGVLPIGTTDKGVPYVGAPRKPNGFSIGEAAPPSEGQRWFKHLCEPTCVARLADTAGFLRGLVSALPLKGIENAPAGVGEEGDQVLVYRLEAPRPAAKFYTFRSEVGEARLHIRKDGSPVGLEVTQAYQGALSPHFGRYSLNRREAWTFSAGPRQIETTKYRLSLRRQEWKESIEAELGMSIGASQ